MVGITGSTGVLGAILKQRLAKLEIEFNCYINDVCDELSIQKWINSYNFDAIFHFAAKVPVDYVKNFPFSAYSVNVGGTIQLCKALSKLSQKPWLFYASSSHVYSSSKQNIKEDDPKIPLNLYGLSKLQGEIVVNSYVEEFNTLACIARIFSFYHESQKPPFLYPNLLHRLSTEDLTLPFKLMGAESVRDLSNAEDIVDKILKLYQLNATGIYNIGSGKGIKIKDFVQNLAQQKLTFSKDSNEKESYLVADISRFQDLITT